MDFNIDFSNILWIEVRKLGVSMEEIQSIFQNPSSSIASFHGEEFIVGFSSKRKFILAAFQIAKNTNFDIEVLQIDLPYEEDIKKYWCRHQ